MGKGGGAREVLVGYIRGKVGGFEADIGNARDIDLILIGGGYLEKIPRGVDFERKGSIEEYFNTRDFHINKVLTH